MESITKEPPTEFVDDVESDLTLNERDIAQHADLEKPRNCDHISGAINTALPMDKKRETPVRTTSSAETLPKNIKPPFFLKFLNKFSVIESIEEINYFLWLIHFSYF